MQGVGFRPFVYRLATDRGLAGSVSNDERGVLLEVEGPVDDVADLLARLRSEAPPLADVRDITREELEPTGAVGFEIVASTSADSAHPPDAPVAPDSATCEDCLAELLDPADRRHRYPFVNCTNCGPRFTIVRGIPYDRPLTTMAGFAMCAACSAEYEDPADRRFHAQPNACPACGPRARLLDAAGSELEAPDAVAAATGELLAGLIVAIKGLGGYHLACRADDEAAVSALRARKHREERPFALLVADAAAAHELVTLTAAEEALLASRERPIVLARRRPCARVATAVAPRAPDLGVMLPYTPLHHLLAADAGVPLVLTSGNVSDEPIAFDDADALARLSAIADRFLVHDRTIQTRTDDSVVRAVRGRPLLVRRSRGFVPAPLALPDGARPALGCGAEQKNAFCVARDGRAWVSHHVGDLKNAETLAALAAGIEHFERLFAVSPEVVAHDLHPDYLSTRYALEREGVELVGVQHHHAHLAATAAEHAVPGPVVGAIYDGTGYGIDGTVWGGELLAGDASTVQRAGHLRAVRMPGGERAIGEPWRMACAWLVELHGQDVAPPPSLAQVVDAGRWRDVARLASTGLASPETTSMGRLFDAVAALCGVRATVSYEGQAAVELEAVVDPACTDAYPLTVASLPPAVVTVDAVAAAARAAPAAAAPRSDESAAARVLVLDPASTIDALLADMKAGVPVSTIAARFHGAVAQATVAACTQIASARRLDTAVLGGGVFANRVLAERVAAGLERAGLRVLLPELLPPNDGQIAYGQVAVAAAAAQPRRGDA